MKAVLISIKPKWCELIASGIKTVEVRKTKPKLETPFKCYIYCTKGKLKTDFITKSAVFGYINAPEHTFCNRAKEYDANGKVIGEFVCDAIFPMSILYSNPNDRLASREFPYTCLTDKEIMDYLGNGGEGYGWHISDLKIYDKPRELSEFRCHCRYEYDDDFKNCSGCDYYHFSNTPSNGREEWCGCDGLKRLTRPPQSWCYVESEDTE